MRQANVSPTGSLVYSRTPAGSSFAGSDDSNDEDTMAEGKQQKKIREEIEHKKDKKKACHSKLSEIQRHGDGTYGGNGYKSWPPQQQKRYNAKVLKYEAKEKKYRDQIAKLEQQLVGVNEKVARKAREAKSRKDEKKRRGMASQIQNRSHFGEADPGSPKLGQRGVQHSTSDPATDGGGGGGGGGGGLDGSSSLASSNGELGRGGASGGGGESSASRANRMFDGSSHHAASKRLSYSAGSSSTNVDDHGASSTSSNVPSSAPPYTGNGGGGGSVFFSTRQLSEPAASHAAGGGGSSSAAGAGGVHETASFFNRQATTPAPIPEEDGEEDAGPVASDGNGNGSGWEGKVGRNSDDGTPPPSVSPTEKEGGGGGWGHKFEQWGSNMTRGIKQRLHINTGKHGAAAEAEAKLAEEHNALLLEVEERKRVSGEYRSTLHALSISVRNLVHDVEVTSHSNDDVVRLQTEMRHELAHEQKQLAAIKQALEEHNSSIKDAVNQKVTDLKESFKSATNVLKAEGAKMSKLQEGLDKIGGKYKQQSKSFVTHDKKVNDIWTELEQHKHLHTRRATDWFAEYLHTCPGWQLFLMVVTLMFILSRMSLLTLTTLAAALAIYRVFTVESSSATDESGGDAGSNSSGSRGGGGDQKSGPGARARAGGGGGGSD